MYSFITHGREGHWDKPKDGFPVDRYLETTVPPIADRFAIRAGAVPGLRNQLALIGYEKGIDLPFRLAWVSNPTVLDGEIAFVWEWVRGVRPFEPVEIYGNRVQLRITRSEEFKMHWSIKDVDLLAVLEQLKLIDQDTRAVLAVQEQARGGEARKPLRPLTIGRNGEILTEDDAPGYKDLEEGPFAAARRRAQVDGHAGAERKTPFAQSISTAISEPTPLPRVFIVHGRDDLLKSEVARYIEKIGLEAVILHEQPNRGRTIIQKFEDTAEDIAFAVVLITPDDVGGVEGRASAVRKGAAERDSRARVFPRPLRQA